MARNKTANCRARMTQTSLPEVLINGLIGGRTIRALHWAWNYQNQSVWRRALPVPWATDDHSINDHKKVVRLQNELLHTHVTRCWPSITWLLPLSWGSCYTMPRRPHGSDAVHTSRQQCHVGYSLQTWQQCPSVLSKNSGFLVLLSQQC